MREWLTVIVVLLIAGILLDGWRRMRQSRHGSIKMSRSIGKGLPPGSDRDVPDGYGSELPNGGARVVGGNLSNDPPLESFDTEVKTPVKEQVALNLEEAVPLLMDVDSELGSEPEFVEKPALEPTVDLQEDVLVSSNSSARVEPSMGSSSQPAEQHEVEVLVINVMAPSGQYLAGNQLLNVLLGCGMRYGDMNIFHRHETENGEGSILFSMANMVKPGDFDLNTMDKFETPGISLFMSLPMNGDSLQAFDLMAATAHELQVQLGGELKDENRSAMTQQTLEHSRQRIREFERKQLSRTPV